MKLKFGEKIEVLIGDIVLTGEVSDYTIAENSRECREYFYINLDTKEKGWSLSLSKITEKDIA